MATTELTQAQLENSVNESENAVTRVKDIDRIANSTVAGVTARAKEQARKDLYSGGKAKIDALSGNPEVEAAKNRVAKNHGNKHVVADQRAWLLTEADTAFHRRYITEHVLNRAQVLKEKATPEDAAKYIENLTATVTPLKAKADEVLTLFKDAHDLIDKAKNNWKNDYKDANDKYKKANAMLAGDKNLRDAVAAQVLINEIGMDPATIRAKPIADIQTACSNTITKYEGIKRGLIVQIGEDSTLSVTKKIGKDDVVSGGVIALRLLDLASSRGAPPVVTVRPAGTGPGAGPGASGPGTGPGAGRGGPGPGPVIVPPPVVAKVFTATELGIGAMADVGRIWGAWGDKNRRGDSAVKVTNLTSLFKDMKIEEGDIIRSINDVPTKKKADLESIISTGIGSTPNDGTKSSFKIWVDRPDLARGGKSERHYVYTVEISRTGDTYKVESTSSTEIPS